MEIWAHRGRPAPDIPGNTLPDFQEAYGLGVHGIETDVCFAAPDKAGPQEPIIHHPGPEDAKNLEINALGLDGFLAFLKVHPTLSCCLELKENSKKLLNAVVGKIAEYGLEDRIYLTAYQFRIPGLKLKASTKLIFGARTQNPKIKTHLIATLPFSLSALARKYNPDMISFGWLPGSKFSLWFFKTFLVKIVNFKRQISRAQNMGTRIIGGIVDEEKDFEYFAELGVDGIMTDNSAAAMNFLKTKSP